MGIGKRNCNDKFYKGFEGEPELILVSNNDELHIWDGYMEDIFGNPINSEDGWKGFSRDYNEFTGPYEDGCIETALYVDEYLKDALLYRSKKFEYEETKDVLNAIIKFFEKNTDSVTVMGRVN